MAGARVLCGWLLSAVESETLQPLTTLVIGVQMQISEVKLGKKYFKATSWLGLCDFRWNTIGPRQLPRGHLGFKGKVAGCVLLIVNNK